GLIHVAGLANTVPALGFGEGPAELLVRRYKPGSRLTLEARAGRRRIAIKVSANDPAVESAVHEALAAAGLTDDANVRVPPLLAWDPALKLMAIGWLEGP